jgi:hypothetical protein
MKRIAGTPCRDQSRESRMKAACGKLLLSWSVLLVGLGFAGTTCAESMTGRYHVQGLFSEPGAAGVYLKEGLPQCLYNLMYIDITPAAGKAVLALLMSAKTAGMTVTRLDYTRDASTTKCILSPISSDVVRYESCLWQ